MIDFHYRRRNHLDGHSHIARYFGPKITRRNDQVAWVIDYLTAPSQATQKSGRYGAARATIEPTKRDFNGTRLWLWPSRPVRLVEYFTPSRERVMYRVDFATLPQQLAGAWYQTDLYLDMFVAADGKRYVIQDEDELAIAYQNGLISAEWQERVLTFAEELVRLVDRGGFQNWLAETCDIRFDISALHEARHWLVDKRAPGQPDNWPEGID